MNSYAVRIELLEEAVRIQNRVMESAMEASNFWREKAMELMRRGGGNDS